MANLKFLVLALIVFSTVSIAQATPQTVKIASLNLFCFQTDLGGHVMPFEERAAHIAQYIVDSKIDVIGLQEVCSPTAGGESSLDIILRLVREKSGNPAYLGHFVETHMAWDGKYREGIGFITKLPTQEVDANSLRTRHGFYPRKVLAATLYTRLGPMRFHVTHLTHVWRGEDGTMDPESKGDDSRAHETLYLKAIANNSVRHHALNVVVGDFNSTANEAPAQLMLSDDGGIRFNDGTPDLGATEPAWEPKKKLDYIFYSGPVKVDSCNLALTNPVNGKFFSDHLGVETVLKEY